MASHRTLIAGTVVFIAGYLAGHCVSVAPVELSAQQETAAQYSGEMLSAYRKSHKSVQDLASVFKAAGRMTSVSGGLNYFAVSVGGTDAEKDLNDGQGVDPETFAALYAERVAPSIAQHLDYDEQGRLRYKGNVIRMYSRERLHELFQLREQLEIQSEDAE